MADEFPKPFTPEQEKEAFNRMKAGDQSARDELIMHNMRLVTRIAKKYSAPVSDYEDFVQTGAVGLIKAVDTFNDSHGAKFGAYASKCIANEMRMYLRKMISEKYVTVYLQQPVGDGINALLLDVIPSDEYIEEDIENQYRINEIFRIIDNLPPKNRAIVRMYYGLEGKRKQSQVNIAKALKTSQSTVSKTVNMAIEHIRNHLKRVER